MLVQSMLALACRTTSKQLVAFSAHVSITRYASRCRNMKKRKSSWVGGHQQQVDAYEGEHGNVCGDIPFSSFEPKGHSFLCEYVLMQVYWVFLQASQAQKIAERAWADGLRHPDIEKLRHIGADGNNQGNVWRDLHRTQLWQFIFIHLTTRVHIHLLQLIFIHLS